LFAGGSAAHDGRPETNRLTPLLATARPTRRSHSTQVTRGTRVSLYVDDDGLHLTFGVNVPPPREALRRAWRSLRRAWRAIEYTFFPIAMPVLLVRVRVTRRGGDGNGGGRGVVSPGAFDTPLHFIACPLSLPRPRPPAHPRRPPRWRWWRG
jgi:hypothetical protein